MKAKICTCSSGVYSHLVGTIQEVCYFNNAKLKIATDGSKNLMLINKSDVEILEENE